MTSPPKRRQRIVLSVVALLLVLLVGAGFRILQRARRTAAVSCLRAMAASLDRQNAFARAEGTPWREWSRDELLKGLGPEEPGDCPDGWWRDDVGLRTRDAGSGRIELHVWRRSDPAVAFEFVKPPAQPTTTVSTRTPASR